jgi:hypothetical protein
MPWLHLKKLSVLTNRHQGKFHLLAIVSIPLLFLLVFLVQNWWLLAAFLLVLATVIWLLFRKR